jgi:hypothetical protein
MTESKMDLSNIRFGKGQHIPSQNPTGDRDMCILEAVALFAGDPWSDDPEGVSPVISAFLRKWNDLLSDEDRDRLLPASVWVPKLVGTCADSATEERRSNLALDWLVRVYTPAYLDLVPSLCDHAGPIRNLPEVMDAASAHQSKTTVANARAAALDAARAVTGDATWTATWTAARDAAWTTGAGAGSAARDAVRYAAWTTWVVVGDAAWTAARAAWVAAETPAGDVPRPIVEDQQRSALDLLNRMLDVKP